MATLFMPVLLFSQNNIQTNKNDKVDKLIQKGDNSINKIKNILAVFQPYLLKAREIYFNAKQLVGDTKKSVKSTFAKNNNNNSGSNNGQYSNGSDSSQYSYSNNNGGYTNNNSSANNNGGYTNNNSSANNNGGYTNNNSSANNNGGYTNNTNYNNNTSQINSGSGNESPQNYLPNQSLPVNNPATVNNDGTGNWGNQNNGLYGNCLDVMTGTLMGMGDAAQTPTSVDLMFFAPADGQNSYYLMTPGFAKNNTSATYMTEHTSDQVQQWSDVNETEVALTKLTIGQFNQIQNNGQIQSAVRNAQNYSGYYSSVGQKLDGQVLAVKVQMENREVYALIAIIKQMGTSGSNGYLKIKIKSSGLDMGTGQVNANAYLR